MGEIHLPSYDNWAAGVITSVEPDMLPPASSPRGRNSYLVSIGKERAVPAKRKGVVTQNITPVTGSPAILGMIDYRRVSAGAITGQHLVISDNGRLDTLAAGVTTATDSGNTTPFTAGTKIPDFTLANNLCFMCNGTENKKLNNVTVQAWGIVAPSVAPTTAVGAAGGVTGTYETRYSYFNSVIATESSISPTGTARTLAAQKLNVSWTVSGDTQADQVKIYVRNTATQAQFYLATTVAMGSGQPAAVDWGADANLIIAAPNTTENNPPPVFTVAEWHQARMFGAGPTNPSYLYYSKLGFPEAQDPLAFERVNTDDGQIVTALESAHQLLVIWKRTSMWVLIGDDPGSWTLRLLDPNIGCTSPRSIVTVEGKTYWWSDQGPARWDGQGDVELIGLPTLAPTLKGDAINFGQVDRVVVSHDPINQQIIFAVPEVSQTRNTMLLPWNYRLDNWVSDGWNLMDISALATVLDSNNHPYVYTGGYKGQVFKFDNLAQRDGVESGTSAGTVTAAAGTSLTDSLAAFTTTGGGLIERYVFAISSDGLTVQRRRITANTATALTITPAWDVTPNTSYTYVVGGVNFEWDLPELDFGQPYWKKRLLFLYLQAKTDSAGATLTADVYLNRQTDPAKTVVIAMTSSGGIYDTSLYDAAVYGGSSTTSKKVRLAKTCRTVRVRIRNLQDNVGITLLKAGLKGELLSDKLG